MFAQVAPCPRDGSACADARNKGIHRSGVREDFRTRRAVVRFRIIRIGELIQKYIAFRGGQPLGFLNGPAHTLRGGGENEFRPKTAEQGFAFVTHGFRHGQDKLEPHACGYDRQANAGVSAGRFDNGSVRLEGAPFESPLNHTEGGTVFDGASRVAGFDFDQNLCVKTCGQFGEPYQRRFSDALQQIHNVSFCSESRLQDGMIYFFQFDTSRFDGVALPSAGAVRSPQFPALRIRGHFL